MTQVTDVDIVTSGADPVLTVTKRTIRTETGVPVQTSADTTKSVTVLAPFKLGAGDPAVDGTILNQCYYDTSSGKKYINTAWPTTTTPTWQEI